MSNKVCILIADPDAGTRSQFRDSVSNVLPKARIIEASDGIEASLKISGQIFDVAILELSLPKKGGQQIMRGLQTLREAHRVRQVIFTGTGATQAQLQAQFPYCLFLKKPCTQSDLEKLLKSLFEIP